MNTEPDRIQAIISRAVDGLDPMDRAERVAYCRAHDEHGVRAHMSDQDDLIELTWGGRRLAMVSLEALFGDGPVAEVFVSEVPDHVPDDL
ncbi:MAG: hypothetical protein KDB72_20985 [Mycobacterium sp.]|nr:hypothetical protein [Mycobacterium sp.]